ncbi:hypothetical protein GCM10009846_31300 [Agrococcus versicolor]|uniref:Uncharacterized protein n=1 Tax=Agrococcus versicolor TaxID=501482 RepID=A0ABP5MQH9_9MICO
MTHEPSAQERDAADAVGEPAGDAGPVAAPAATRAPAAHGVRRLLRGIVGRLPARRPTAPRVARVFDGQRDGTPWFAPEHPVIVDAVERDALLALLRTGSIVVHASQPMRDDLGDVDAVVPADLRSDGTWIWSDAVAYYLERHRIAPDAELVAHLRTAGPAAPIDAGTWRRLSAAIRPDAWEGTTWPLD